MKDFFSIPANYLIYKNLVLHELNETRYACHFCTRLYNLIEFNINFKESRVMELLIKLKNKDITFVNLYAFFVNDNF